MHRRKPRDVVVDLKQSVFAMSEPMWMEQQQALQKGRYLLVVCESLAVTASVMARSRREKKELERPRDMSDRIVEELLRERMSERELQQ
ncbi:hypothetical protein NUW54_g3914 [Trametes sanguinea]|uniref:Uncharacterized protein n=1 Tax=Trametes sanguinea TaxID=158606 RepID=A0ACC1Q1I9_9APHY|nr:hypothetical protein NUW54_g3914 [Trametes sanguinea]